MTKSIIVSLFLFVICSNLYSQTVGPAVYYGDLTITQSLDYYSLNYLSTVNAGKGFTCIASDSDIMSSSLNPASLKLNKKYQVFASFVLKDNVSFDVFTNVHELIKQNQPAASFGFGYKISKDFQVGFVYNNVRNVDVHYDLGSVNNNGNFIFNQQTFSVPVTYDYKFLRFGTNLNLILYHGGFDGYSSTEFNPEANYTTGKANTLKFVPDFGVKVTPSKIFSFGLSFTPGIEFDNEWTYSSQLFNPQILKSRFPMKLGAGIEFRTIDERLKFTGEYRFVQTSVLNNTKDRHNVHFGVDFKAANNISVRAGMFTLLENEETLYNDLQKKPVLFNYRRKLLIQQRWFPFFGNVKFCHLKDGLLSFKCKYRRELLLLIFHI